MDIHIIQGTSGSYDSYTSWIESVWENNTQAQLEVDRLMEKLKERSAVWYEWLLDRDLWIK